MREKLSYNMIKLKYALESEIVSERTKAGLERVKLNGKKLGRPKNCKNKKKRIRKYWKKPVQKE